MFLKSETSLEFNQLHVFEPYIFFDFVKQLCVVFWMISLSNSQNSSLLVVSYLFISGSIDIYLEKTKFSCFLSSWANKLVLLLCLFTCV